MKRGEQGEGPRGGLGVQERLREKGEKMGAVVEAAKKNWSPVAN